MTDTTTAQPEARDYSDTLFLPKTEFPMRAGLPKKEPQLLERWDAMQLYKRLRETSAGREKFVLHDGPPYANGNLHIGHALNKILKDVVTRSHQMLGYDSNYVPGWDCHGLPIEWKVEESYRAKGLDKDEVPVVEFRKECRQFAEHWVGVQSEEFRRFGVEGDFADPYLTMSFAAEAQIARELMKFAGSGQLYRGSKPVMWSVVEKTALAEAEIEYQDYESDTIWVKFPVKHHRDLKQGWDLEPNKPIPSQPVVADDLADAFVVIWTTTPWTIPGNRAICFSPRIAYGLYEVTAAENDFGPQPGEKLVFADALAEESFAKAKLGFERVRDVPAEELGTVVCAHPLNGLGGGYSFDVPLLSGDHVTDDAGTGFVHTAPGHGTDDFEVWMDRRRELEARGIDTAIPYTVDGDGTYTSDAPGFEGRAVYTAAGKKGDANKAVIEALIGRDMLFARGRLKHQYPHSWRSKKPVIFRNTPQWFVHMDKPLNGYGLAEGQPPAGEDTLRTRALAAIDDTRFVPAAGKNRLRGMIQNRPDWVLSRQRAWGVPITVFRNTEDGRLAPGPDFEASEALVTAIADAFEAEGADAWFAEGAKERFLAPFVDDPQNWEQVTDILDVWFDSGSTHAFVLEKRPDLKWPADVYLEGSDQHRGWFHSSLLESCATRGRAPYGTVVTHGFTMAEDGRKMSKSLGNSVAPQDVIAQSGADILRLWVMTTDYADDQRIGPEILKGTSETYRKVRNSVRWMLGTLGHADGERVALTDMPELERLMLHRLVELDRLVRQGYRDYDYKRIAHALINFTTIDLSAFYFDIRKDALYCDPVSSTRRKAALQVIDILFEALTRWLAPMLPFTMEEAHLSRHGDEAGRSIHLELFPEIDPAWESPQLAEKWARVREVRRVVLGALEIERREKRIRGSLEAHVAVHVTNPALYAAVADVELADVSITSQAKLDHENAPADAFRLDDVPGVAVVVTHAEGTRCARSWKVLPEVGSDPDYPDLTLRDAEAMRELDARTGAA
ncbi:isoleucine--tRNA ligase [Amorphus coralli]|uniref:isoleucine--tRNA ligase n=1 Tax=Amorphus coralli TaxID=340680 RepID=UPI00036480D1|nr:isoleucine--tRNA ligase [Amorphus coralli]